MEVHMKKKILFTLSEGGHTSQALLLIELLGKNFNYEYVIDEKDKLSRKRIKFKGKIFKIHRTRKYNQNLLLSLPKQITGFFRAFSIVSQSKANLIVSFGASFSLWVLLAGKILGKKIAFIETWSRCKSQSTSGKFAYLFSDLFIVQHKEQLKFYPKAVFLGRLG
jgi:UDP-N-acetylglucosamine:LPS N-acetylglucosamine transferase